jgi:hypothetical protein
MNTNRLVEESKALNKTGRDVIVSVRMNQNGHFLQFVSPNKIPRINCLRSQ